MLFARSTVGYGLGIVSARLRSVFGERQIVDIQLHVAEEARLYPALGALRNRNSILQLMSIRRRFIGSPRLKFLFFISSAQLQKL